MKAWRPDYTGYGHRTRIHHTVWGHIRYDWGRYAVVCRMKDVIRHPKVVAHIISDSVSGWRYAGTIFRFERIARALDNGPIPYSREEWEDFSEWMVRMVPHGIRVLGIDELCARETPRERAEKYCGRDLDTLSDEELFRLASSMFGHYSDRMYPNAYNGAKLCLEIVRLRQYDSLFEIMIGSNP